ncbi:glycoside hydrolase [Decorospora gaudefroyi]|uniref:Mannosyl-oligosaccharide glucosidase n=1 Tax=Decorospora gaudefroyi TaxID=184978 RepID=A0A6A5KGJ1_9PLEO|nr:glycoside hydrolase [Decorospora gaudefroyi]
MRLPSTLLALVFTLLTPTSAVDDSFATNEESLLWGPYRPNLYLGLRPRVPNSLIAGLMWGKLVDVEKTLRHNVNMSDGMARYGWTAYDTRQGGRQIIEDIGNQIDITTEFIKHSTGQSKGDWGLRIRGIPRAGVPPDLKTTVVFYVGMEAMDACPLCKLEAHEQLGTDADTSVRAVNMDVLHPELGAASINVSISVNETGQHESTVVKTLNVTEGSLWQAKSTFLDTLKVQTKERTVPGPTDLVLRNAPGNGNMQLVQMVCHGRFQFDVLYSNPLSTRAMTSETLTSDIESVTTSFAKKFNQVFNLKPPFKTEQHLAFSENVFSNLLGGLGYFSGTAKVDTSKKAIYAETTGNFWEKSEETKKHTTPETKGPYELLTHTPSRATFPRGFLWDEGFHLLLVIEWDADLAIEVLRGWLALMDEDGWIAREQILGAEAESATPADFITQYPHIANPPTMFLVISKLIDMLNGATKYRGHPSAYLSKPETGKALITELYPLLKKHYDWFRNSQSGDVEAYSMPTANLNEGYRWRGRTPETNLASGFDDYPRAEPPDITELHLDAVCWVSVMARTLEKITLFTLSPHDALTYQSHIRGIRTNLETLHWDSKQNMYCDTIMRDDQHTYICHKGYVSLFPLLTGLMDATHPHLAVVLDLLRDPQHLWTDHGIRSLSPQDKNYGMGENYWRSPIWIHINYLLLTQLLVLARASGPHQTRCRAIYTELRANLVHTVFSSYRQTGFTWEQYNTVTGHGQRTQGFTGWTSVVVSVMAMPDLENGQGVTEVVLGYYDEAKRQAARGQTVGVGSGVFVFLFLAFLWVTRRRFAGTFRGLRRR